MIGSHVLNSLIHICFFVHTGYIVVVMIIGSHALVSVSPTLIIARSYAKFCCKSTSDKGNNEPVEWLNSNLDVLTATDHIRIRSKISVIHDMQSEGIHCSDLPSAHHASRMQISTPINMLNDK